MQIYLPIAEMSVNIFLILGMGGGVGFLSGLFGVGGGFLMTPLLIFIGIPPAVAVATEANQIVASSVSGVLAHWRRGNVDLKMGVLLLIGGVIGSTFGVWLFTFLKGLGQIDLVIKLSYVVFLGVIGSLMLIESLNAIRQRKKRKPKRSHSHNWMHGLPFKMRFRKSRLYISAVPPILIGIFVGILSAIMGVGGGFVMVPGDDLSARHADRRRRRHIAFSNHLRDRKRNGATIGIKPNRRHRAGVITIDRRSHRCADRCALRQPHAR